ncbi:MAG: Rieske (2Fe-2S) protein [Planctomycetota bacterium]|nr:MAG: Rieske (2Fe-2S) protein [Planctomycetota bacterium]
MFSPVDDLASLSGDRELEGHFLSRWMAVAFVDSLPTPEARRVFAVGSRSFVVARDRGGALHVFVNACTHRGTRLCRGAGRGRMRCPYHGWVFGCDGRLLGATRRSGLPPFDDAQMSLRRLAVRCVGPVVFAHRDPAAALDLDPELRAEVERLGGTPARRWRRVRVSWRRLLRGQGSGSTHRVLGANLILERFASGVRLRLVAPRARGGSVVEERAYGLGLFARARFLLGR